MTEQTVAEQIAPKDFGNVVEAVKMSLSSGDTGLQIAGLELDAGTLKQSVADAVENALSISLLDALLQAWSGIKTVSKLVGRDGPVDGKPRVAALANHKFKITHTPEIQVRIGEGVSLRTIEMPVTLMVAASGVVLTVRDRKVIKATVGHLVPKLTIKVEKVKVVDTTLKQINLSGDLWVDKHVEETA